MEKKRKSCKILSGNPDPLSTYEHQPYNPFSLTLGLPPTLEMEYVFVFSAGFFVFLVVLTEWEILGPGLVVGRGYLQKLPDPGRMSYGREKKGFSPTHSQATPPEKLPSPRYEMTTDTFIYWTSLFLVVPTASPSVRSGNSHKKPYLCNSSH